MFVQGATSKVQGGTIMVGVKELYQSTTLRLAEEGYEGLCCCTRGGGAAAVGAGAYGSAFALLFSRVGHLMAPAFFSRISVLLFSSSCLLAAGSTCATHCSCGSADGAASQKVRS